MKKFRTIIIAIIAVFVIVGCASHLIYSPNGTMEASNYTISETLDKNGKVVARTCTPFVPDRWYSDALDKIGPMVSQLSPLIKMWIDALPTKVVPVPIVEPVTPPVPVPVPTPTPEPTPIPVPPPIPPAPSTVFTQSGNLITLNMENVPAAMNRIGIPGGENELWYSLAHVYAYGPGKDMVSELAAQNPYRQQIFNWFDGQVLTVIATMKAIPALNLIAITNDGKDRCGFRLGPAIMERVLNDKAISASRVQLGNILPPEQY